MNITPLLQSDSRWGERPLGTSNISIAKAGCALTCVTMVGNWACENQNAYWPNEVNALLNKINGYQDENLIRWYAVPHVIPVKLENIGECMFVAAPVDKISAYLAKDIPVIVKIDYDKTTKKIDEHWVLLIDTEYHYNDPYTGTVKQLTNPALDILKWVVYTKA